MPVRRGRAITANKQMKRKLFLIIYFNLLFLAFGQSGNVSEAARLRREGDRFFYEAQAELEKNDFIAAQRMIQRAADAYDQSLELEYDEETFKKRSLSVFELDNRIAEEFISNNVDRVRELLRQIQESYYGGNFEYAEKLIAEANYIWKQTQIAQNGELEFWAQMIQTKNLPGTTIPYTHPLYPEISQLLNNARKHFEEGREIILSSPEEGERILKIAKAELQQIQLVFPLHEDVCVLDLLIEQVLAGPDFITILDKKIENAILLTRKGSPLVRQIAVFDLRIYRRVFPAFCPDWADIIFQAEMDAGLRKPQPTAEEITEAQLIIDKNRAIVTNSNGYFELSEVINELDRAIALDPNNQEAKRLKDLAAKKIRIVWVSDIEAELLFQQASQALINNNPLRAQQLLNQLYERNSDYKFVPKVKTLQQRIVPLLED